MFKDIYVTDWICIEKESAAGSVLVRQVHLEVETRDVIHS